jgi:hypothetical protein
MKPDYSVYRFMIVIIVAVIIAVIVGLILEDVAAAQTSTPTPTETPTPTPEIGYYVEVSTDNNVRIDKTITVGDIAVTLAVSGLLLIEIIKVLFTLVTSYLR